MNKVPKAKRIGFFGGTFDPVHFGHINLCLSLMEKGRLDEVIVSPSGIPPVKSHESLIARPEQRLHMVKLAFQGVPQVIVSDYEISKKSPCYTVETLRYLKNALGDSELFLLMGGDVAKTFPTWKGALEIRSLAKPLVAKRKGDENISFTKEFDEYFKNSFVDTSQLDISSTEIKERLSTKKFCAHLVPSKVLDYIYSHHLYF